MLSEKEKAGYLPAFSWFILSDLPINHHWH